MIMVDAAADDDYLQTVVQYWDQCDDQLTLRAMHANLLRMKRLYDDVTLALIVLLTL